MGGIAIGIMGTAIIVKEIVIIVEVIETGTMEVTVVAGTIIIVDGRCLWIFSCNIELKEITLSDIHHIVSSYYAKYVIFNWLTMSDFNKQVGYGCQLGLSC